MTSQFAAMTSLSFFCHYFLSLVKFIYWSMFNINIITGSGVMTIFFHKGLTRNPEIGNFPVWVLRRSGFIWKLVQSLAVWIRNLAKKSQINSYFMLQNTRVTAFMVSVLLRENQQGVKLPSTHPD